MDVVIFAAGKSTRTHPLTLTRPKPLLPIVNKPLLQHQLEALSGVTDRVFLVVGYRQEMIRERFGASFGGIRIEYVEQTEQKGTGHALLQCEGSVRGSFLAMNGDDLYAAEDLRALAAFHGQAALTKQVEDPRLYGVYTVGPDGKALSVVEKPEKPESDLASVGAYKFTDGVFDLIRSAGPTERGEFEIVTPIQMLIERGQFYVLRAKGYWLPIGYPWHLLNANEYFLEHFFEERNDGEVRPGAYISGKVSIGKGTVIKPGSVIEGPVIIGDNCTIGPNCWLRPGATIGNGCNVGQGVEVKNSIVMDGAKLPHLTYVGDSIIGASANLGCGTITANFRHDGKDHSSMIKGQLIDTGRRKFGAVIGDHVHTGIHTSIYPGRKLWPNTSTLPGEVVHRDKET